MAVKIIPNSIVLSKDNTEYLNRTFVAPTDSTKWTFSVWFKRGRNISDTQEDTILSAGAGTFDFTRIMFTDDDKIQFEHFIGAGLTDDVLTTARFRDPTAWYHLVVRYDSNEVTATDRIRFWVDNVQITYFDTSNFPTLAQVTDINTAQTHEIGRSVGGTSRFFDGYLADYHFCDGQTLSPTSFAEDNNGTWQPITPSVTFGNNGFALEFGTDSALGDDTSGNTNDWTTNNIGVANQREDTPTANHVTWNISYISTDYTAENGARQLMGAASSRNAFASALLPKTGKYYWECDAQTAAGTFRAAVGIGDPLASLNDLVGSDNHGWGMYNPSGTVLTLRHNGINNDFTDTGTFQTGDYAMVAFDTATGNLWFGINGTWLDSGDPGAGTNPAVTITDAFNNDLIPMGMSRTSGSRLDFRAGAEDFEGTIPTGFNTLDITTWPEPPITDPKQFFDIIPYAGDGINPRSFTNFAFQPDLVWVKIIDDFGNHLISDTVKGAGFVHHNDTPIADNGSNTDGEISAFNADGFSVNAVTTDDDVNNSGNEYVGFAWKEGATPGLDLVGYVGTAAAQAVNHSLGATPEVMYVRNRDTANNNSCFFQNLLDLVGEPIPDPETDYLEWDSVLGRTDDITLWNDTAPTPTQFTVGTAPETNTNGDNHAAYLWREIEGFSKFTSYKGSGSINSRSPYIYCGFRPKVVFIKFTSANGFNWGMFVRDNAFTGAPGGTDSSQFWSADTATGMTTPASGIMLDFCASGFNIQHQSVQTNDGGSEYLAIAFAEIPYQFKSAIAQLGPAPGAGALDLKFEINATGDDPHQHGDGAPNLNLLITASGDNGGRKKGNGVPDIGFVIDGTGTAPEPPGVGRPDIIIQIDGTGSTFHLSSDGATDLGLILDGIGFNTAIRGSPVLPQLSTAGSQIQQSRDMVAPAITLPLLQMGAVTLLNANPIFGEPKIPVLQTDGEINPDFDIELPILQTVGTIISGATLRTSVPGLFLPQLRPNGTLLNPGFTSGLAILPRLRVTGIIQGGAVITVPGVGILGASTLPALEANGFLLIPQEMAGAITLPALDLDPLSFLAPGAIVTGSVTLPLLRLESILVNGVTLAATVWSMNTETLETTNYLNFDFVSLVNFADQPFGVTSTGIFLLEGADDDGTNIDARILTGISDRGDENLKEAAHMYMQYDGGAMVFQLLPDGQKKVREYRFDRRSNSSGVIHARAKGSRGLRSRSWQMGLRNLSGGDFTLDKLGLLLRQLTRKTRKN